VKFHFFSLETTKSTFSAKHVTGQIQISKSRGALSLPASVPTSINSQMRATYFKISMALLRFRKCLHWFSGSIRLRVMAVHDFKSHERGFLGHL